jgi:predicted aspartyl protease
MARNILAGYIAWGVRPCVLLRTASDIKFPATVDTGFNGQLLMDKDFADRLGVMLVEQDRPVTLAGGITGHADVGLLDIEWFNTIRQVGVHILEGENLAPRQPQLIPPEREVLLGTRLMHPGRLTVDFLEGIVRLSK